MQYRHGDSGPPPEQNGSRDRRRSESLAHLVDRGVERVAVCGSKGSAS